MSGVSTPQFQKYCVAIILKNKLFQIILKQDQNKNMILSIFLVFKQAVSVNNLLKKQSLFTNDISAYLSLTFFYNRHYWLQQHIQFPTFEIFIIWKVLKIIMMDTLINQKQENLQNYKNNLKLKLKALIKIDKINDKVQILLILIELYEEKIKILEKKILFFNSQMKIFILKDLLITYRQQQK